MAFDFPNAPTIGQVYNGYVWDGQAWQVQGASQFGAVRKKNYIINGAMMVSQEFPLTNFTISTGYPSDMWQVNFSNGGTTTYAQVSSVTPGGSPNRIRVTATVADASVAASDFVMIRQGIEGLRVADLRAGSASAKTITVQFGCKGPAGTYCVAFINASTNRSYVAEYVISGGEANTDVVKSVTITLDTTGTWASDNTVGIYLCFALMCGSTFQTTAGSWAAGNFIASSNQFNFMGTNGNVFELFDVSLTEGNVAQAFVVPDYATELNICKRYWQKCDVSIFGYTAAGAGGNLYGTVPFSQEMRVSPTLATLVAPSLSNASALLATIYASSKLAMRLDLTAAAAGAAAFGYGAIYSLNARL